MSKSVNVAVLPQCDICRDGTKANFDAKTKMGPWAYMCGPHFNMHSVDGTLGTGKGQRLIVRDSND